MVQFDTIEKHGTTYNDGRDFIEVARKNGHDGDPEQGTRFISITRGYNTTAGDRRFKMHFTFPDDRELVAFLRDALDALGGA